MAKNDPTGKTHATVTKTTSQQARKGSYSNNESTATGGSSIELLTPKNILSGLKGVLADSSSNASDSTSVGSGSANHTQSSRSGLGGGISLKPNKSSSTNFGR